MTRTFGECIPETWARTIDALRDDQIINGLERLLKAEREWPPNLTQFVTLCKTNPQQPRPVEELPALPPPCNLEQWETGQRNLAKLRAMLGMKPKPAEQLDAERQAYCDSEGAPPPAPKRPHELVNEMAARK